MMVGGDCLYEGTVDQTGNVKASRRRRRREREVVHGGIESGEIGS